MKVPKVNEQSEHVVYKGVGCKRRLWANVALTPGSNVQYVSHYIVHLERLVIMWTLQFLSCYSPG